MLTKEYLYDYLCRLYFGEKVIDKYDASISRAYLDFNRTLHGFGNSDNNAKIKKNASELIKIQIKELLKSNINNQETFDNWHRICGSELIEIFKTNGYRDFTYGQSQKWINMTFKYLIILDIEEVQNIYEYLHIPIDNIVLDKLKDTIIPKWNEAWSRIIDYDKYLQFQSDFRDKFKGIPIENEFELWKGGQLIEK